FAVVSTKQPSSSSLGSNIIFLPWRAASSQMLDKRGMVLWSNLFHIGILGIFFGHLFGMLTPHWMYAWFLPVAVKQQMAMILGGICGVLTLIGGAG
ncbi:respiratory nitrate reductase subunit gamma, partial [Pseudomonas aeruginosa]|uniref:respiratory nitrate reductase subunit gamma n=1 Tax=Pseudomonas aeruginosa TaxID=287 RepID=UPI0031B6949C